MINASARPQEGHSRVYNKNLCEVAVLFNEEPGKRDLILQLRNGGIQEIADTHRSSDSLNFFLIHPFGHDGWHTELKQVNPDILDRQGNPTSTNSRVTVREFYAFHVQERIASSNCLLRMCRLFQEFIYV